MATLTGSMLKALATFASRDKMRFALNDIHVQPLDDHRTAFEATDGRRLMRLIVQTNGAEKGFIPIAVAKSLKARDLVKVDGREVAIFAAKTGLATRASYVPKDAEGSFPRTDDILECEAARPGTVGVNPSFLSEIGNALASMIGSETQFPMIRFTTTGPRTPIHFEARGFADLDYQAWLAATPKTEGEDADNEPKFEPIPWSADAVLMPCALD